MLRVLALVDEGDGLSRTDGDTLLAAHAGLAEGVPDEDRQMTDVVRILADPAGGAAGRAGVTGDLLDAVNDRLEAVQLFVLFAVGRDGAGTRAQDVEGTVPFGRNGLLRGAEGEGELLGADAAREDGR
jgi:hypothetical protein